MTGSMTLANCLEGCSARILINGELNGTGFFVTPKDVVTNEHVAYDSERLEVVDRSGKKHLVNAVISDKALDLAWIKLKTPDTAIPVALLGELFSPGDKLFSFGYPSDTSGEPVTFETEGLTGDDPPRIKFKGGQVELGASGSPLLNMRTGAVCAVLQATRGKRTDLGGYGVPISTLLARTQFLDLRALNYSAHASDPRWTNALTTDQKTLSWPRHASEDEATELVMDMGQHSDGWCVSATWLPDGKSFEAQLVDLNVVRSKVARLFRAWRSQQRIDDSEQARTLGEVLYRSIFPKELAKEFESRSLKGAIIDLSLHFANSVDRDLRYLPWEQLYTPDSATRNQISIGSDAKMRLARVLATDPAEPPPPVRSNLDVLLVTAPLDVVDQPLQYARDMRDDVLQLKSIAHLCVHDPEVPDLDQLQGLLSAGYDVLHYVGYGLFGAVNDKIAVAGHPGKPEYVSPQDFADCVSQQPPRLLVIQATLGPYGPEQIPGDLTELAIPLLKAGVAAVVVFQFPLSKRDPGNQFNKTFYRELMAGSTIRTAVQRARNTLVLKKYRWDLPALFERQPNSCRLVSSETQTMLLNEAIRRNSP